jgi:hypothetical protein
MFQRNVVDIGFFLERLENLHFAAAVFFAFIFCVPARKGIDVGEVIHRAFAGLQNDFIAADTRSNTWARSRSRANPFNPSCVKLFKRTSVL